VVFTADDYHFNVTRKAAIEMISQGDACETATHDDDSGLFHTRNLLYVLIPRPPVVRSKICRMSLSTLLRFGTERPTATFPTIDPLGRQCSLEVLTGI
jgi:hypothetical protein